MTKISIIIPIYNEAKTIQNLLQYLLIHSTKENIADLIIVDGGSTDDINDKIPELDGVTFLKSEKGRAKQMNLGAKHAHGDILYFLHADSYPPKNFDRLIIEQVLKDTWKSCRGGDQSQFITKSLFKDIGCYNEAFTIYEDNDLISKLYQRNQFTVIQEWLTTSARHYNTKCKC